MRVTVPLRSDGRIVIPHAVRRELNLEYGDLVELRLRRVTEGTEVHDD